MRNFSNLLLTLLLASGILFLFHACEISTGVTPKRIVILAGPKSHPAGLHEYIKSARLIKVMLDNAPNLKGIKTEICYNGWPENESILDSADLILTLSDGRDGPNGQDVPFFTDERMGIIGKQVGRGCGMMTFHYSTFAPDKFGEKILEWTGGYFDWQNEQGEREWYSDIRFMDVQVELLNTGHPVMKGVDPFRIWEEYYFKLRFRGEDNRLVPLVNIPGLGQDRQNGGVVAWAVNREDGSRGFGTTLGHFYGNWKNDDYRKLILNAIIWAAGAEVPEGGVESQFYTEEQLNLLLTGTRYKALVLTGNDHPAHNWKENTPAIKKALESGGIISADVSVNIHDLSQYDLRDYDILVFNYCNWEDPDPIWAQDKEALMDFAEKGGGLMFIHFANGAFHFSLPGAEKSEWPEYRRLCRRVWNHKGKSSHDPFGEFTVTVSDPDHEITRGLQPFTISDELYYNQEGDKEIQILLSAVSKITNNEEPMAWVYEVSGKNGKTSRVFQSVLGHSTASLETTSMQLLISNAAVWAASGAQYWNDL